MLTPGLASSLPTNRLQLWHEQSCGGLLLPGISQFYKSLISQISSLFTCYRKHHRSKSSWSVSLILPYPKTHRRRPNSSLVDSVLSQVIEFSLPHPFRLRSHLSICAPQQPRSGVCSSGLKIKIVYAHFASCLLIYIYAPTLISLNLTPKDPLLLNYLQSSYYTPTECKKRTHVGTAMSVRLSRRPSAAFNPKLLGGVR
jgi:hypothetical protein